MQFRNKRTKRVVTATGDDAKPYQADPKWDRLDAPQPVPEADTTDTDEEAD